ncbi:hypothetical protein ETD86_27050 [Nonomuraea turkmeniaca]|uniref:Uncharacterized protein n=1 Tax=Nonomuraea turkmeniaca TaxID=103838 RepID=A0A5S4FCD2_9ACTN|nr:hypothetical protein [Nonomuraea turkmeniaca]TMR15520.1 hypothetical protein ETD86_27050 [Nonomuraea turkmeniaca]
MDIGRVVDGVTAGFCGSGCPLLAHAAAARSLSVGRAGSGGLILLLDVFRGYRVPVMRCRG